MPIQPSLDEVTTLLEQLKSLPKPPNLIPLCASISSEFLTPSSIYLKIANADESNLSFLFESAATTETISRYSFIGASPRKVLVSGPKHGLEADPLPRLNAELSQYRTAEIPSLRLPPLTGGAIGYIGYDCIKYFEPKTRTDLTDILELPESLFMLCDTIIAVDHFFQKVIVITYLHLPSLDISPTALSQVYEQGRASIAAHLSILQDPHIPLPPQPPITLNREYTSNIGQPGYESHVATLKSHIIAGDIIQCVPSQRISRPTSLHPFNIYRHLRTVNPSPYLFYLNCATFQIIGASPEVLVKEEHGRIITHPIAGTVKRGPTPAADAELASTLRQSLKDRAEHVMLVDLARNDVNRVCSPLTTRVDKLMVVQKFSHVQHLVSEVSGVLRPGKTRFDAFRSIFPAGTVSGAPKVRAMQLIGSLEKEKRGVYAGAVGYFGYGSVDPASGAERDGAMDTCIALRTMVTKPAAEERGGHDGNGGRGDQSNGGRGDQSNEGRGDQNNGARAEQVNINEFIAYLQAGGGIVFDSDPTEEYEETMNKCAANMRCIEQAEKLHWEEQQQQQREGQEEQVVGLVVGRKGEGEREGANGNVVIGGA